MPRCSPAARENKKDASIRAISCPSAPNGEALGSGSFVYIPMCTVTRHRPRLFTTRRRSLAPPTRPRLPTSASLISSRAAELRLIFHPPPDCYHSFEALLLPSLWPVDDDPPPALDKP